VVEVGQRQRHRDEHVGIGLLVDHLPDVRHRPLPEELLGRQLRLVLRGERRVEGVEMVGEHLAGPAVGVLRLEVEHVRDTVEHEHVVDHLGSPLVGMWRAR
jgi:hypothetical protein